MARRALVRLSRPGGPPAAAGVVAAAVAVAAVTALIYPLRQVSPTTSDAIVYLLPVLLISTLWGLWLGLATSVAGALAFNFFHIPPTGGFTIASGRNWVALVVYLVVAVVASSLADLAEARRDEAEQGRRDADLAAELARVLLGGTEYAQALAVAAERVAAALDLPALAIQPGAPVAGSGVVALPLVVGGTTVASVTAPVGLAPAARERLEQRLVPTLEALLAAALERRRLQGEAVEAEALRRSDEIKTALLRTVSHDLRTPLTAIVTAGDVLSEPEVSPAERRELAAAISADGARLAGLVDKLLDLSRLQAGAAPPRRDWCSIDELVAAAVDGLDMDPGRFVLSLDRDLPLVEADGVQLERALANLLENAARYSGDLPISVRARVVGRRLMIRVVDRGPGISGPELERIFEPFYRSPAHRGDHTGSGLGLAIVKGFVEANGGRVWAESLPGQGTSFVIELPLPEHAPPAPESGRLEGTAP